MAGADGVVRRVLVLVAAPLIGIWSGRADLLRATELEAQDGDRRVVARLRDRGVVQIALGTVLPAMAVAVALITAQAPSSERPSVPVVAPRPELEEILETTRVEDTQPIGLRQLEAIVESLSPDEIERAFAFAAEALDDGAAPTWARSRIVETLLRSPHEREVTRGIRRVFWQLSRETMHRALATLALGSDPASIDLLIELQERGTQRCLRVLAASDCRFPRSFDLLEALAPRVDAARIILAALLRLPRDREGSVRWIWTELAGRWCEQGLPPDVLEPHADRLLAHARAGLDGLVIWNTRAMTALGCLRDPASGEWLRSRLDDRSVRVTAIEALLRRGEPVPHEVLVQELEDHGADGGAIHLYETLSQLGLEARVPERLRTPEHLACTRLRCGHGATVLHEVRTLHDREHHFFVATCADGGECGNVGPLVTTGPVECRATSDGAFWDEHPPGELPSAERRMQMLVRSTRDRCPELFE